MQKQNLRRYHLRYHLHAGCGFGSRRCTRFGSLPRNRRDKGASDLMPGHSQLREELVFPKPCAVVHCQHWRAL
jgi:hypothetical protein